MKAMPVSAIWATDVLQHEVRPSPSKLRKSLNNSLGSGRRTLGVLPGDKPSVNNVIVIPHTLSSLV